jgi:4-hydroxy-2-oxoheptanedioate aldolase
MQNPKNLLKAALVEGRPQIGLWAALANPISTELLASAGFDFLVLDGEHAPNDLRSLLSQLQAMAAYPTQAVVRATSGDANQIKQLLDIGAQTLLIPWVETAEQARMLVRAVRYPPEGIRGVGSALTRSSRWTAISDYVEVADREICLIVQVETKTGVDNVEEIAAVEGVDCVFIGPSDLSASMGHRGKPQHPEVLAAMDGVIERTKKAGKAPGILWSEESGVRRFLAQGCLFMAVGSDALLLANTARAVARKYMA